MTSRNAKFRLMLDYTRMDLARFVKVYCRESDGLLKPVLGFTSKCFRSMVARLQLFNSEARQELLVRVFIWRYQAQGGATYRRVVSEMKFDSYERAQAVSDGYITAEGEEIDVAILDPQITCVQSEALKSFRLSYDDKVKIFEKFDAAIVEPTNLDSSQDSSPETPTNPQSLQ